MGFKKNHFYKLVRDLRTVYQENDGNFFCSFKHFKVGEIYQAENERNLYTVYGIPYFFSDKEKVCFEEVDIGLNEVSKRFLKKNEDRIKTLFTFTSEGKYVEIKMVLLGRHFSTAQILGNIKNINSLLIETYSLLKKNYGRNLKNFYFDELYNFQWLW